MTDLMQLLYDYTLNSGFSAALCGDEYRAVSALVEHLGGRLRQALPGGDLPEKYLDALMEQRDLELEAMFRAALALSRELP